MAIARFSFSFVNITWLEFGITIVHIVAISEFTVS